MKSLRFSRKLKKPKVFVRRITGDSMLPLFKPGHVAVGLPLQDGPKEGQVVIVRHGGLEKIKRIKEVKDGRVYVIGDNARHSTDSRSFGWLHASAVIGRVVWPRVMAPLDWVRIGLRGFGATVAAGMFLYFMMHPTWPTPDKLLVFLTFVFMAFGQAWAMLKRLVPFGGLLLIYESFRGIVPHLNHRVNFTWMPDMDKLLFGGKLPTVQLQQWLYHGSLHWYDFIFYMTYMLHFVLPLGLAILVWKLRPAHYWRVVAAYVLVSFGGFITFLLFPAAPPWMASAQHIIPQVHRITSDVYAAMNLQNGVSIYNDIGPNPVAAVPSLHAGYATLLVIFVWMLFGVRWGLLALAYPLIIFAGTVYSGEHYAIDEIIGALYAIAAFMAVYLFTMRRRASRGHL